MSLRSCTQSLLSPDSSISPLFDVFSTTSLYLSFNIMSLCKVSHALFQSRNCVKPQEMVGDMLARRPYVLKEAFGFPRVPYKIVVVS